jgi:hypothetical protein
MSSGKKKTKKKRWLGWNIFLSYSEEQDRAAKKAGYAFLGYGKDYHSVEFRAYRMWKLKDKRKELEIEEAAKRGLRKKEG